MRINVLVKVALPSEFPVGIYTSGYIYLLRRFEFLHLSMAWRRNVTKAYLAFIVLELLYLHFRSTRKRTRERHMLTLIGHDTILFEVTLNQAWRRNVTKNIWPIIILKPLFFHFRVALPSKVTTDVYILGHHILWIWRCCMASSRAPSNKDDFASNGRLANFCNVRTYITDSGVSLLVGVTILGGT